MSRFLQEKLQAKLAEIDAERAEVLEMMAEVEGEDPSGISPLAEFIAEPNNGSHWLVDGVIPAGSIGMLAGDSGAGKSTLAVQMALCMADGRAPWYAWPVSRKVRTLHVNYEGARLGFQARVKTAMRSMGVLPEAGWFTQAAGATNYSIGSPGLEAMIKKSQAELVVLDTVFLATSADENDSLQWRDKIMQPLKQQARGMGTSFMLVHHHAKSKDNSGWRKLRGTSAMFGDLDWLLQLEGVEGDATDEQRVLRLEKSKYSAKRSWTLRFDKAGARLG